MELAVHNVTSITKKRKLFMDHEGRFDFAVEYINVETKDGQKFELQLFLEQPMETQIKADEIHHNKFRISTP